MKNTAESIAGSRFGKRYYTKGSWRRLVKYAKRAARRARRRDKLDPNPRVLKGWVD
jgi:hypothetical protein